MSYRPITDFWILGRTKTKYYGSYPAGFLERARPLLVGGNPYAVIAHIPGGKASEYNGKKGGITLSGFGVNDWTIDLDPACNPDVCFDVRNLNEATIITKARKYSGLAGSLPIEYIQFDNDGRYGYYKTQKQRPNAVLIDRPYTLDDADHYLPGRDAFPNLNKLLRDSLEIVEPGGFVGVIDFEWPQPGKGYKEIAAVAVSTGRSSRIRIFTTWKKM